MFNISKRNSPKSKKNNSATNILDNLVLIAEELDKEMDYEPEEEHLQRNYWLGYMEAVQNVVKKQKMTKFPFKNASDRQNENIFPYYAVLKPYRTTTKGELGNFLSFFRPINDGIEKITDEEHQISVQTFTIGYDHEKAEPFREDIQRTLKENQTLFSFNDINYRTEGIPIAVYGLRYFILPDSPFFGPYLFYSMVLFNETINGEALGYYIFKKSRKKEIDLNIPLLGI